MTFAAQLDTDLDVFFNTSEHAQSVTYNSATISAIVTYGEELGDIGGGKRVDATLFVKAEDVASPDYRDTVVIDSVTFRVQNRLSGYDGRVWKLELSRAERPELR